MESKTGRNPTNADEYTYLVSAIKTLFTKINGMMDIKNMFKITLFTRKFLGLFPESVKDRILEKINCMRNIEDMDSVMKDLDYLKWQIVPGSSSSNSSNSKKQEKPESTAKE
ncbi:MAG: hypothetical protein GY696_31175 [Gammaproteobacteria bacterium]|nr:hypothetical protein [Gammaproteobacteria bacterium]